MAKTKAPILTLPTDILYFLKESSLNAEELARTLLKVIERDALNVEKIASAFVLCIGYINKNMSSTMLGSFDFYYAILKAQQKSVFPDDTQKAIAEALNLSLTEKKTS